MRLVIVMKAEVFFPNIRSIYLTVVAIFVPLIHPGQSSIKKYKIVKQDLNKILGTFSNRWVTDFVRLASA